MGHRKPSNLFLLVCFAFHTISGNHLDESALLDFKTSLSDPTGLLLTWNSTNSDPCSWVGVSCGSDHRVAALNVTGGGSKLIGKLPSAISKLSEIRVLSLPFNGLDGQIPLEIGSMRKLEVINLQGNLLSGKLSLDLVGLKSLRVLNLGFNQISGEIPGYLLDLTNLTVILLNNNKLSGPIPSGFTRMLRFDVSFNEFPGPLPRRLMAAEPPGGDLVDYSDPGSKTGSFNAIEVASITLASAFASVLLALIVLYFCARWRPKPVGHGPARKEVTLFTNIGFGLDLETVIRATNNFNASNCIGNGGFGATYRAVITPGFVVAVKRLAVGRFQGVQQFEAEIKTLGRHRHPNLVTLIGYHASETEMFLIYNYLSGGNLEQFIQERSSRAIDWQVLYKIALDVARALAYLHDRCVPRVLHRDVKPSNILLDDNLNAYLSDFGLARLLGTSETHATTGVAGTYGYVAPEYAMTCRVSDKADVYSYGVVLLELLSDKKALDPSFSSYGNGFNIVGWALMLIKEGRAKEFFTAGLWAAGPHDDLVEVLHLAVVCTEDSLSTRPTMKEVVRRLRRLQAES